MAQTTGRPQVRLPGAADGGVRPTRDLFNVVNSQSTSRVARYLPAGRGFTRAADRQSNPAGYYSS